MKVFRRYRIYARIIIVRRFVELNNICELFDVREVFHDIVYWLLLQNWDIIITALHVMEPRDFCHF